MGPSPQEDIQEEIKTTPCHAVLGGTRRAQARRVRADLRLNPLDHPLTYPMQWEAYECPAQRGQPEILGSGSHCDSLHHGEDESEAEEGTRKAGERTQPGTLHCPQSCFFDTLASSPSLM